MEEKGAVPDSPELARDSRDFPTEISQKRATLVVFIFIYFRAFGCTYECTKICNLFMQ